MVELTGKNGVYLINGKTVIECSEDSSTDGLQQQLMSSGEPHMSIADLDREKARTNTIAYQILQAHNRSADKQTLKLKVDALASHDITYVGIIQTARASGLAVKSSLPLIAIPAMGP